MSLRLLLTLMVSLQVIESIYVPFRALRHNVGHVIDPLGIVRRKGPRKEGGGLTGMLTTMMTTGMSMMGGGGSTGGLGELASLATGGS